MMKPKERPIIFNASMVSAILDSRKTQARRIIKPQPILSEKTGFNWNGGAFGIGINKYETGRNFSCMCKYGKPGDKLWVRETTREICIGSISITEYTANNELSGLEWDYSKQVRPSIHMPRWASRITLEITNVRVERLRDISEEDALAEGCVSTAVANEKGDDYNGLYPTEHFYRLWDSIYGKGSWFANPWVWVIEFKRII